MPTMSSQAGQATAPTTALPANDVASQPTNNAADISSATTPAIRLEDKDLERLVFYTNDIIDKQYRSYSWTDLKMQAIITVDGLLLAAAALFAKDLPGLAWAERLAGVSGTVFLFASVLICLKNCVPVMHSRIGNYGNLRTIIGIISLNKADYYASLRSLSQEEMLRFNANQISGMALNNHRSHIRIIYACWATGLGTVLLCTPIVSWNLRKIQSDVSSQNVRLPLHVHRLHRPNKKKSLQGTASRSVINK